MKCYQLCAVDDLRYMDIPKPLLKKGWCLVEVKACGICSSDIARIYKNGTYHFPTIPGHEFSGVVRDVADEKNKLWIGKRVGVFPLIPCKNCENCNKHHYEMCSNYDYLGSRRDGGFSEYVTVPIWNLIELPSTMTFQEAALLEPLSVGLHAVKKADIKKDISKVAVIGTGMIGLSIAQWAKYLGSNDIVIIGRSGSKKTYADAIGIPLIETCDIIYDQYDIVIEAVGSNAAVEDAILATRAGGKIIIVGNPENHLYLKQEVYWKILRKQLTLIGSWNSSYESNAPSDWEEVCHAIVNKQIIVNPLISHEFSKDKLMEALKIMRDHTEPYCKIILNWDKNENGK